MWSEDGTKEKAQRIENRSPLMSGQKKTTKDKVLVIADDLTGALEAGAKFAAHGIKSLVVLKEGGGAFPFPRDITALILDTETRHVPPDEAASRVFGLASKAADTGFEIIYKKTDSTLRGNIASELNGLLKARPGAGLLYVPAYPKMGRTVKNGVLYVDGTPVSTTEFGADALNPVAQSSIPRMLASHVTARIISVNATDLRVSTGETVYVCDAGTEEEVERLAKLFVKSQALTLAAGPSGFLQYLANEMAPSPVQAARLPQIQSTLIVNGSRNKRSVDQIQFAIKSGFPAVDPAEAGSYFKEPEWWILEDRAPEAKSHVEAATCIANNVVTILGKTRIDGLVIFGGDTAYAVLKKLGQSLVHPMGEVIEGVPVSRLKLQPRRGLHAKSGRDIVLITKAGGFGPVNLLPSMRDALSQRKVPDSR